MHQLNLYDYSARQMDGIRFTSVDPLAEIYYSWSPYAYCANNPMKYIDPTGMSYTYNWDRNRYEDENGNEASWEDVKSDIDKNASSSSPIKKYVDLFFGYIGAAMGISPEQINSEDPQVRADASQRRQEAAENIETAALAGALIAPFSSVAELGANADQGNASGVLAAVPFVALDLTPVGKAKTGVRVINIVFSTKKDLKMLKFAKETFKGNKRLSESASNLLNQVAKGNLNPGIGSKHIGNGIYELRSKEGVRIYFKNTANGGIDVLGYSNKSNQRKVLNYLLKTTE